MAATPRYQITEIIGRGGMGEVCLADDLMLDRKVALKFVTAPDETDGLDQLLTEARAAAALDHPFICSIYEVTVLDGRPCIAMEYIRGESLERRLRGGPLPFAEAVRVADEIAEALDAAHRRRVVHSDLKPANVMLTEDGHIKVMDFGLARRLPHTDELDHAATMLVASRDALVQGTPAYMAPEQIRGEAADRRSDVFAFGILLYEMVSGINPFKRASIETTFAAILREPIATLHDRMPAIPSSVDALLLQLLAKEPAARSPLPGRMNGGAGASPSKTGPLASWTADGQRNPLSKRFHGCLPTRPFQPTSGSAGRRCPWSCAPTTPRTRLTNA